MVGFKLFNTFMMISDIVAYFLWPLYTQWPKRQST